MSQFLDPQRDALRSAVEYAMATGVNGDIVEFGCYLGKTAAMLAESMWEMDRRYGYSDHAHKIPQRRLWALDSFEGFPETTDPVDAAAPHIQARLWYAGQPAGGTPESVAAQCAHFIDPARISVVPGWYKDTLKLLPRRLRFAVVHIDCDYYESTKQVLEHLLKHDMLSDGATILFDDWYCNRGSPEFGEQRAWREVTAQHRRPAGMSFTDWGPYGVVGRRFIVHGGGTA